MPDSNSPPLEFAMLKAIVTMIAALCALNAFPSELPVMPAASPPTAETYRIEVDITNQITTVCANEDGHIVRQMICSTGRGESTPLGTFKLEASRDTDRSEWYYIGNYQCYVRYPTRIQGPILFHSLPYTAMDLASVDAEAAAELGSRASHGCVRLNWEDAKWIAENCPDGTTVRIFSGAARKNALRAALLERAYIEGGDAAYAQFAEDANAVNSQTIGLGVSGNTVSALQEDLATLGLLNGPVTGLYDGETVSAVTRFQRASGQRATGSADAALCRRIAEAAQAH